MVYGNTKAWVKRVKNKAERASQMAVINKMSDGLNLTGFNDTKAGATNNLDLNPTGQEPKPAFPAKDVSSQDGAGLGNGGK